MMRAWENRPDCEVWDEPLYAAYLRDSGVSHPMREQILAHDENDWQKIVARCVADAPGGSAIYYQKHMTHHLLPHYSLDWLGQLQHCFLLRHPREVLRSYSQKRECATLGDIGIVEQLALFDTVTEQCGRAPLIIDSGDFLARPEAYLRAICAHFDIEFNPSMLVWPAGKRDSDGVWADHWYANVRRSTGFGERSGDRAELDESLYAILEAARPAYEQLRGHCLVV